MVNRTLEISYTKSIQLISYSPHIKCLVPGTYNGQKERRGPRESAWKAVAFADADDLHSQLLSNYIDSAWPIGGHYGISLALKSS